jgi:NAD(P)-dependent dehydrogenase (short-subunit alcohol dehydrogenase family)
MSKNYLIIGASSGIGEAIAEKLSEAGHNLYLASRSKGDIKESDNIHFQELDVTKDFELELPEKLDGIAYCPGTINLKPFGRFKEEDFLDDFKVNHLGAVKVLQQSISALKKADSASVVFFSTVAVQTGLSFHTSVASAKGALEGLTKSLACELAPKVRVNAIAPSLTDTPLASSLLSSDEKREANAKRHPLKKLGTTEDIANAAEFLLTDRSSWVTGQIINVDGGLGSLR